MSSLKAGDRVVAIGGTVADIFYLESKEEAKRLRYLYPDDCHVSRGPDHIGKHGHKLVRSRLQPKGTMNSSSEVTSHG